jgi:hypothetical protein
VSLEAELREELTRLRIAAVRRLRERLEDPGTTATPAYLDVARKLIGDLMVDSPPPRLPPIVADLPFPDPENE